MRTQTAHGRSPPNTGSKQQHHKNAHKAKLNHYQQQLKLEIVKTTVIESGKTGNKVNTTAANAKAENNGIQPKTNGLPLSIEFDDKAKGEAEVKKAETPTQVEQPKAQDAPKTDGQSQVEHFKPETPKAEPTKAEIKEVVKQKPLLNLEGTLKLVEELHRRKIQRDRLLDTIDALEAFEVAQIDDADETEANHFQGCIDHRGRQPQKVHH